MILVNKPQRKTQESGTPVFQELKGICMSLGMSKPPANITMFQFFSGIEKKVSWLDGQSVLIVANVELLLPPTYCTYLPIIVFSQLKEAIGRVPPNHVGEPLLMKTLGPVHMVNTEAL